jgi:hypothetical protein
MIKKILLVLLVLILVIQFFRPDKNESNDQTYAVSTTYKVPDEVGKILQVACSDCHSNKTEYPWYANFQPTAWWLDEHVQDGKRHLNFSNFTQLPLAVQNHKFEEVVETVEKKEMPLESYTYLGLHAEANLTEQQRTVLIDWAKSQMAYLKATYPADSLVLKRRKE